MRHQFRGLVGYHILRSRVVADLLNVTVVINAGDLLARWSNDLIKSTEHQVVEPPRREAVVDEYPPRYSCAYGSFPS